MHSWPASIPTRSRQVEDLDCLARSLKSSLASLISFEKLLGGNISTARRLNALEASKKVVEISANDGGIMTTVQVRYDGYNRQLKILRDHQKPQLEDGEVYTLAFLESENGVDVEWIDFVDPLLLTNKT